MSEQSTDRDWAAYYARTGDRPPRETLTFALDQFDAETGLHDRFAVDLGAGGGRDTIEMLRRGWRVLAIDAEPDAIKAIQTHPDLPADADMSGVVARFSDAKWPKCDLVNSSFALPLCPPDEFMWTWNRIRALLRRGGRFAGHLFGDRDSWAGQVGMTFHTRSQVDDLLRGMVIERLNQEEDDSTTVRGEAKHWHLFHIVARKP